MNKINSLFSLFMIPRLREVVHSFYRLTMVVIVLLSCSSPDFKNPFDPHSAHYVPAVQGILIDDFDDGTPPNLLGYPAIPFGDANILVTYIADGHNVLRGSGFSLQIEFDVRSPDTACGGWVWPLVELGPEGDSRGAFDLKTLNLNDLTFWTKAESPGLNFEVAVLGKCFTQKPEIFLEAMDKLGPKIVRFGFVKSFKEYATWLWKADILPVNSIHDFFGASVIQAMYCNCYPLFPKRLAYPEHLPPNYHDKFFYENFNDLVTRLENLILNIQDVRQENIQTFIIKYDWQIMAQQYDNILEKFVKQ